MINWHKTVARPLDLLAVFDFDLLFDLYENVCIISIQVEDSKVQDCYLVDLIFVKIAATEVLNRALIFDELLQ